MQPHRRVRRPDAQVDRLHENREAHREVDVALRDVEARPVGHQRQANHQEERQRQHLHGRVAHDEVADRLGRDHHDADGDDDGGDHDRELAGHADGGDDRVEGEDDVEDHDLADDGGKRRRDAGAGVAFLAFELLVDFDGGFPEEEEAAADEDEVASREAVVEGVEERLCEAHDPGEGEEEQDAHAHGAGEAEGAGAWLLVAGQLADQDGDEDDVVDAEDDFEKGECGKRDEPVGGEEGVHGTDSSNSKQ